MGNSTSESNLYALLDKARVLAADQVHQASRTLLSMLAADLATLASSTHDSELRRSLEEAAEALVDDLNARCEVAASVIDEMQFRLLQARAPERRTATRTPTSARRNATPALLPDSSDSEQLISERVGEGIVAAFGAPYTTYLRRLAMLGGRGAEDRLQPLGARGHVLALVTACRPYASARHLSSAFEGALVRICSAPIATLIAQIDRHLRDAGVRPADAVLPFPTPSEFTALAASAPGDAASPTSDLFFQAARTSGSAKASTPLLGQSATAGAGARPSGGQPEGWPDIAADDGIGDESDDLEGRTASRDEHDGSMDDASIDSAGERMNLVARAAESVSAARLAGRLGRNALAASADARGNFRLADRLPTTDVLDRDARTFADRYAVPAYSSQARQVYFRELRAQMRAAGADPAQLMAVDLVTAMFDYALDDRRLPDSIRPLLWRLQQPSVVLAALDPGYLGDDDRSIRSLVENLAAVAIAFPDQLLPGRTLHARLATVVRAVEVVAHAFHIRSRVLSEQVDREYRRATIGMSQLVARLRRDRDGSESQSERRNRRDYRHRPSRDLEVEVTRRIERFVSERLRDRNMPSTVVDFLNDAWVRHMRTAALRDGEESTRYLAAAQVVEDLLWTIDGSGQRRSRKDLIARIPTIIRLLTRGVDEIGARNEEFRPFFDELFVIHLRRMQRGGRVIDAVPNAVSIEETSAASRSDPIDQAQGIDRTTTDTSAVTEQTNADGLKPGTNGADAWRGDRVSVTLRGRVPDMRAGLPAERERDQISSPSALQNQFDDSSPSAAPPLSDAPARSDLHDSLTL